MLNKLWESVFYTLINLHESKEQTNYIHIYKKHINADKKNNRLINLH